MEILGKMRKVELLPTQECEAGYTPELLCNEVATEYPHHTLQLLQFAIATVVLH